MSANDRQVGGEHYKRPGKMEHWDIVVQERMDYFCAAATKYIFRHRLKDGEGRQGIEKAIHYLEKLLEVYHLLYPEGEVLVETIMDEQAIHETWSAEQRARENYEIEGYRADGTELFKCKHCRQEAWGILALRSRVKHLPGCPHGPQVPGGPEQS